MHRDGILFATNPLENPNDPTGPPPNLAFLEIAAEFTNKLLKQDKRMVLQFLDRILTMGMPSSRGEEWQPLLLYRNSLVHGETDLPPQTARRAYGRRRRDAGNSHFFFSLLNYNNKLEDYLVSELLGSILGRQEFDFRYCNDANSFLRLWKKSHHVRLFMPNSNKKIQSKFSK